MSKLAIKTFSAGLVASSLAFAPVTAAEATPRTNEKVTICHRTHATTNPYRMITVSMSSIIGNGNSGNGHGDTTPGGGQDDPDVTSDHSHNPYYTAAGSVFDPTFTYPNNHKQWQDIIPPFNYVPANGNPGTFAGLNWTDEGKAIFYGYELNGKNYAGLCSKLSAKDFAQKEYESYLADNPNANTGNKNQAKTDATQDVKDQGNIDDPNLNGKNFDDLPTTGGKPAGPGRPSRLKQLQDDLDTANTANPQAITQAIAGVVWFDDDKDGVQDQGESFSDQTEIQLIDPTTNALYVPTSVRRGIGIATTTTVTVTTDANGYFQLDNVPEGDWIVKVITPSGYVYTYDSSGTNDGQMPGTYVPSGGIGFAWAGLVQDPNAGSNTGGGSNNSGGGSNSSGSGSSSELAGTGSADLWVFGSGVVMVAAGAGLLRAARRRPKHSSSN
jgi:hypothetical protein